MSDINLDFTVSNNSIDFTVQPNDITITPTDVQLTLNANFQPLAGGSPFQLQFNNAGILGGVANSSYTSGNLTLGNVANIKITGGTNGYVLQTDGAGNLDWTAMSGGGGGNGTPGGSNTQIQYNDAGTFGGNAGFTFNEVSGNVAIPGSLAVTGNITGNVQNAYLANYATVANSVAGANVSGQVNYAATANSVAVANVTGIGNIAVINLTGSTSNVLYGNGVFAPIVDPASANFANYAGNVTVSSQPNITSLGNLVSLTLTSANIQLGNGSLAPGIEDIAIGNTASANKANSSYPAVAIGESSYAVRGGIAIGQYAGKFGSSIAANANLSIAIGQAAGYGNSRGANSIAIGTNSGINCAVDTVSIGRSAGYIMGGNSIAIGALAAAGFPNATPSNTITINATGSNLIATQANSLFVKPIRNSTQSDVLYYNTSTGEITYSSVTTPPTVAYNPYIGLEGTAPAANTSYNYDVLNGSYQDISQLNGNFVINIRGNSTSTFNSIVTSNTAVDLTLMCLNSAGNAFYATDLYIDGSDANVNVSWSGAAPYIPPTATFIQYKITIFKSAANTFRAWIDSTPMYGLT